jgi:3-hydroxyacyl-CoA dehydrogenase/enoyl-CoA hydratase/3-hydroxybutyryl-CoA epimerase/enoyl-CoA isomerase
MHFFNPAHIMPLVEVVPHDRTGPDTLERAKALAATLGKRAILVKDTPGFFVNRVLFAYIQGFCTLLKDTLDHERIDDIMVRSGWPMGPAALLDAIGIDTCLDIGRILVRAFPDTFSAAFLPVLEPLVRRGWTGRKSGVGFYRYSNDEGGNAVGEANGKAIGLWGNLRNGSATHVVPAEEILDRLMLPVTNEVFRCIEEGVISGPEQADQAIFLSMGYGRKGGVCKQLRKAGVGSHLAKCGKYQSLGDIYRPPGYLLALAK